MGIWTYFFGKHYPKYSETKNIVYPLSEQEKIVEKIIDDLVGFISAICLRLRALPKQSNVPKKTEELLSLIQEWLKKVKTPVFQKLFQNLDKKSVTNFETSLGQLLVVLEKSFVQKQFVNDQNYNNYLLILEGFGEELAKYKNNLLESAAKKAA